MPEIDYTGAPIIRAEPHGIVVGGRPLTIEDVYAVACRNADLKLNSDAQYQAHIDAGPAYLDRLLRDEGVIYGVTTAYGDSCTKHVPIDLVPELPYKLVQFLGVGMGRNLSREAARAVCVARLVSLSQGLSGTRYELLQRLEALITSDIIPCIPEEGSVGASGDLAPLSYLAAVLMGERQVLYKGEVRDTADVFQELSIQPYFFRPKEALAVVNGTAMMTGLACLAFGRANYLARLTTRITALAVAALQGNPEHFDARLFAAKPHPGQQEVAGWLRQDLGSAPTFSNGKRVQDRYSLRCAPHVIGVLVDSLPWLRQFIERELNSANDNPLIDATQEVVLHGGHFYGGHIAFAMDSMKHAVAHLADLMDRQLAQLCDVKFNNGLPSNLSGAEGPQAAINHGFKGAQIAVSAWTSEALHLSSPSSIFSRSTECHNQDKVSLGTIATRSCLRVLELVEQVAAACLMAACQGVWLRERSREVVEVAGSVRGMVGNVMERVGPVVEDRPMQGNFVELCGLIRQQHWALYDMRLLG